MSERESGVESYEVVREALDNKEKFEAWLNALPDEESIKGETVTQYLVEVTGLSGSEVSVMGIARPDYLNRYAENLNKILEEEYGAGKHEKTPHEEEGFTKQELLTAYHEAVTES